MAPNSETISIDIFFSDFLLPYQGVIRGHIQIEVHVVHVLFLE